MEENLYFPFLHLFWLIILNFVWCITRKISQLNLFFCDQVVGTLLKIGQCICFPISWNPSQFFEEVFNFYKREHDWSSKTRLKIWIDDSHKYENYPTFMWCKIPMGCQCNELSTWICMWMLGIKVTIIHNGL